MTWPLILGEFASADAARALHQVKNRRIKLTAEERHEVLIELIEKGLVRRAGSMWVDDELVPLYQATEEGRMVWEVMRRGLFIPPKEKDPLTFAQRAIERNPVSVFDLVRIPFTWDRESEQLRLLGFINNAPRRVPNVKWVRLEEPDLELESPWSVLQSKRSASSEASGL
jgi:hypothetical protein